MIFLEYVFLQEFGSTGEFRVEIRLFRNSFFQHVILSGCSGENIQQYAEIGRSGCLVQADADLSGFEITQVHLAFQCDLAEGIDGYMFRQLDFQRVEIVFVQLLVAQLLQFSSQETGRSVYAAGDVLQSFGTVVNGVEACHCGQ